MPPLGHRPRPLVAQRLEAARALPRAHAERADLDLVFDALDATISSTKPASASDDLERARASRGRARRGRAPAPPPPRRRRGARRSAPAPSTGSSAAPSTGCVPGPRRRPELPVVARSRRSSSLRARAPASFGLDAFVMRPPSRARPRRAPALGRELALHVVEPPVGAVRQRQQLRVRALLRQLPVLDHEQPRRPAQRREPVRDGEHRAPRDQPVERLLDLVLRLGVDGAGGLVEDQDARVVQDRPRDRDALALAARERVPALADHGVVAVRQLADEVVRVRRPRRRDRPRRASRRAARSGCSRAPCRGTGTDPGAPCRSAGGSGPGRGRARPRRRSGCAPPVTS